MREKVRVCSELGNVSAQAEVLSAEPTPVVHIPTAGSRVAHEGWSGLTTRTRTDAITCTPDALVGVVRRA
jgi:hypothetical protein